MVVSVLKHFVGVTWAYLLANADPDPGGGVLPSRKASAPMPVKAEVVVLVAMVVTIYRSDYD